MTIVDRIRRSVANRSDEVYLRGEFERFGSPAQVSRALATLIQEGLLVRFGVGVYAKAKPSVLSGEPISVRPLEVLAPQVLRKLGVPVRPSRLTRTKRHEDLDRSSMFDRNSQTGGWLECTNAHEDPDW